MVEALVGDTSRAAPSTDRNSVVASRLEFAAWLTGLGLAVTTIQISVYHAQNGRLRDLVPYSQRDNTYRVSGSSSPRSSAAGKWFEFIPLVFSWAWRLGALASFIAAHLSNTCVKITSVYTFYKIESPIAF
jgi:hypothetical protein